MKKAGCLTVGFFIVTKVLKHLFIAKETAETVVKVTKW